MASTTPQPPMAPPPAAPQAPARKTNPLVWILAGCGGLIVICVIVMMAGGYFLAHKAKGFAQLAQKNPAMAAARMLVAVNPDVEIVSEDDDRGIITIRNKKTGEELIMNAEDIKAGKLKFKNEKGEEVTLEGHGEAGKEGLTVKSNKGEMTFGAGNTHPLPSWVPSYPGVKPVTSMSKSTAEGLYGSYMFQISTGAAKVLDYYETALKESGFTVERTDVGGGAMGMGSVSAKRDGGKREVNVSITPGPGVSVVSVQYTTSGGIQN